MLGSLSDEESRKYLQDRLAVFSKVMFWAFLLLVVFQAALYEEIFPAMKPHYEWVVYIVATCSLTIVATIWRVVLVRKSELSIEALYRIDLFYMALNGGVLGGISVLVHELHATAYTCLIYASFAMFSRTLLVPSSATRTAIVSTVSFVPMAAAASILPTIEYEDLPGQAFAAGGIMLSGVAVVLATVGSYIIYDLRRRANTAQQLGQYRLEGKIGAGGMGEVYRASHVLLRRQTAVKLLRAEKYGADNIERFEREVQLTCKLTHPNTVAIFDYGPTPEGAFYYAMEYLGDGLDLEQLVRKDGPQPASRVAHILGQVCGALFEAHERGIFHRDIKPSNIILCERGLVPDVAKVVDFGLAKEKLSAEGSSATMQVVMGTPGYVAPEVFTDPGAVGAAADLYAVGAVGYYLLTGKKVFEGATAVEICTKHITQEPTPPSKISAIHVDPALEAVIMKCLAKQPGARHASAEELARALAQIPPTPGWNDEEAKRWWRDLHAAQAAAAVATDTPTITLTVDLGHRELA